MRNHKLLLGAAFAMILALILILSLFLLGRSELAIAFGKTAL